MRILKHWKVILAAVLLFGAGGVTGSVLSLLHFKRAFERGLTVENWTSTGMKFLQKELELTPEQAPRIRTILEETGQQFAQTFREAINVSGTNLVASWIQIDRELTPEQRIVYQDKCQEFRDTLRDKFKIDLPPRHETIPSRAE